jgi:CrcB protein
MDKLILVFLGGGFGSVLRYWIGTLLPRSSAGSWPWSTWIVNVAASAILGFLAALILLKPGQFERERLLLGVGFCGGLSTFSAFTLEGFELIRNGQLGLAVAYMIVSTAACLLACWAAWSLQR